MADLQTWSTALVTGASSGIGAEIARQLGPQVDRLVLLARDEARLAAVGDEAVGAATAVGRGLDIEVLPADLSTDAGIGTLEARVSDAANPVDLLVNNAGFGVEGDFVAVDADRLADMVEVNVVAVLRATRAALPAMITRGRGSVVNVSSLASLQPSPGFATYGATKAFVTALSESVYEEVRGTGVTVTAVLPGFTRTEFQERAGYEDTSRGLPDVLWQDASDVAAEAIAGAAKGRAVVVCGTVNKVTAAISTPVPRSIKRRVVATLAKRF